MSESALSRESSRMLERMGWLVWRLPVGKARGRQQMLPAGTPDKMALKRGRVVFLEFKSPDAKARQDQPAQPKMHATLRAAGFRVAVVRSVDEAIEAVRKVQS